MQEGVDVLLLSKMTEETSTHSKMPELTLDGDFANPALYQINLNDKYYLKLQHSLRESSGIHSLQYHLSAWD